MRRARRRLPRLTDRLRLGETPLRASPICLGAVGADRTIAAAFEAGVNCFFITADMHWPLYEASRRGLRKLLATRKGIRDEIVVVVACYVTQPDFCTMPFAEVLAAVDGLGHIDVALMGGVYGHDFMPRHAVYAEHKRLGRFGVRAIGASFHERRLVPPAVSHGLVDMAFTRYNPAHTGARDEVFPLLPEAPAIPLYGFTSTIGYVDGPRRAALGLGKGYWQPSVTDYYRFALTRRAINGVLCSTRTPRELQALARALESGPLSADEEDFLVSVHRLATGEAALVTDLAGPV